MPHGPARVARALPSTPEMLRPAEDGSRFERRPRANCKQASSAMTRSSALGCPALRRRDDLIVGVVERKAAAAGKRTTIEKNQ